MRKYKIVFTRNRVWDVMPMPLPGIVFLSKVYLFYSSQTLLSLLCIFLNEREARGRLLQSRKEESCLRKKSTLGYRQVVENISMKTVVYGEKTLMVEFDLRQGAHLPNHDHPHEQTGYLVSGRMKLTIGEEVFYVGPGDSWSIPGGVKHCADILENSIAVEVFAPVREDYLPAA